jgi:hypothetical protein
MMDQAVKGILIKVGLRMRFRIDLARHFTKNNSIINNLRWLGCPLPGRRIVRSVRRAPCLVREGKANKKMEDGQ